ncbi:MAG: CoA ester lyase [Actinomycetia bacterium]|nr:CoA ester lyase [Actinomycetes bacterium]
MSARRLRSLLFAPASRPDVVAKLPRSEPDGIVLDLEDAVAASGKSEARAVARELGGKLASENPGIAVYVRVNAVVSEWFADDMRVALQPDLAGVVVPKLDSVAQLDTVAEALAEAGCRDLPVLAGIETAAGVAHLDDLLRPPVAVAYFGAEDFVADMGGVRTAGSREVLYARSRLVLAARLAGVHPLDQIVASYDDEATFVADAEEGRALGYRGKLCIHPNQVPWANRVFSPSEEELDRAHRLLDAYTAAAATGDAVIVFDGQMVDEPMARRARALLEERSPAGGDAGPASAGA